MIHRFTIVLELLVLVWILELCKVIALWKRAY